MRNVIRLFVCLSLLSFGIARAVSPTKAPNTAAKSTTAKAPSANSAQKPVAKKADAKTLIGSARKALAAMVKDARTDKGLDPKTAKNKPFWKSTQLVAKNLKTAEKGLAAKNNDFFKGIEGARKAGEQLKVDWQLTDSKNKAVIDSGRKLDHAVTALRKDFSKEAARKKKGGELTAQEKSQFEKIKAEQKQLLGKIDALEAKSVKDKALQAGLKDIKKLANEIINEPATLDRYLAALYLSDVQAGLIRGYDYYVDKDWRSDYGALVTYANWYDKWYYEWADPVAYDWVYTETSVNIYEDVDVVDTLSDADIDSQDEFVENEPFDMTDAEEEAVAEEEDADADVADDGDDSMEDDAADDFDDGGDADDGGDDEAADDAGDDGGGDDGGDDGGGDDGGGDEE